MKAENSDQSEVLSPAMITATNVIDSIFDHANLLENTNFSDILENVHMTIDKDKSTDASDFLTMIMKSLNHDFSTTNSTLELINTLNPVLDKLKAGSKKIVDDPTIPINDKTTAIKALVMGLISTSPSLKNYIGEDNALKVTDAIKDMKSKRNDVPIGELLKTYIAPFVLNILGVILPQFKGAIGLISMATRLL